MSSNIKTKNTIYGFRTYDIMPYQSIQHVDYAVDNTYVNAVSLNNTYGQCVDNDMFAAKKLLSKTTIGNSANGPVLVANDEELAALPDGAKFFMSSSDATIMQKTAKSFQQTLTYVRSLAFSNVKAIHKIDSFYAIVSTDDDTYLVNINQMHDAKYVPSIVLLDEYKRHVSIDATLQYGKYSTSVFAGKVAGQPYALLKLVRNAKTGEYCLTSLYEISEDLPICALAYADGQSSNDSASKIAFATSTTVYLGDITDNGVSNVKAMGTFSSVLSSGTVCALVIRPHKLLVFTSSGQVYDISYLTTYTGFQNAAMTKISDEGIVVYETKSAAGDVEYLATNKGLCILRAGTVVRMSLEFTSEVKHLEVSDGIVWCGDAEGHVLRSSNASSIEEYALIDNASIIDFKIVNGVKIAVTSNGVMFEETHGQFRYIAQLQSIKSPNAMNGFNADAANWYIAGKNGNALSVVNAQLQIQSSAEDYQHIDGVQPLSSFSTSIYDADVVGLASLKTHRYAFVNFRDKSTNVYDHSAIVDCSNMAEHAYVNTGQITGILRVSDNNVYAFCSYGIVKNFINSYDVVSSMYYSLPASLENCQIIGSQMMNDSWSMLALSNENGFQLANMSIANIDELQLSTVISNGVATDIIKYNDDCFAFVKNGNMVSLSAFALSTDNSLYGKDVPAGLLDVDFISKDDQLSIVAFSHGRSLSATYFNGGQYRTMYAQLPVNAFNVHFLQCNDQAFAYNPHIIYTVYDSTYNKYDTCISSFTGGSIVACSMQNALEVNVLNIASDYKTPMLSYDNGITTVKYEHYSDVAATVQSHASFPNASLKEFGIDSSDQQFAYAVDSNNVVHRIDMQTGESIAWTCPYSLSTVHFPSHMLGNGLNAYAQCTDNKHIAFNVTVNQNALTGDAVLLDSLNGILEKQMLTANIGMMVYEDNRYSLLGSLGNKSFDLNFRNFGEVNAICANAQQLDDGQKAQCIVKTDASTYIVQTDNYLYQYSSFNNVDDIHRVWGSPLAKCGFLKQYSIYDSYSYYTTSNNKVISSQNLHDWHDVMTIGPYGTNQLVTSFEQMNSHICLAGKTAGSNLGLYFTYYNYDVECNTTPFTAESAYYAYYDNRDMLDDVYSNHMSSHVQQHHIAPGCDMQLINNYMGRDFQLSGFMHMSGQNSISNDYIDQIASGNTLDGTVVVHACNSVINNKWTQLCCNYIAKFWKSGMTDLYIYLPTTNTFYIPHIEGASQCDGYDQQMIINGRRIQSNIIDNVTSVRVNVMSSYFNVTALLENTIKANSLPLRIFKDETYEDEGSNSMFHSFVCPSIAQEFSNDDAMLGYYAFQYYCFGSDAQAIKLSFFSNTSNYAKPFKTVVYHANGGKLAYFPGMKSIQQRIYENDTPQTMFWDIFEKNASFFVGWSSNVNALSGDVQYAKGMQFAYESMQKNNLNLYACWVTYRFGKNDTTVTLSSSQTPMDYTIAEIIIDPNAEIPNNPQIGSRLIVDYGD